MNKKKTNEKGQDNYKLIDSINNVRITCTYASIHKHT